MFRSNISTINCAAKPFNQRDSAVGWGCPVSVSWNGARSVGHRGGSSGKNCLTAIHAGEARVEAGDRS